MQKKTVEETTFINLFSRLICANTAVEHEKITKMLDFTNNAEFYYDVFCEAVHSVMINDRTETLSLDEEGHVRLDFFSPETFDKGYVLVSKDDISNPDDDVIVYVNIALQRLLQRVIREERLRA